MDINHKRIKMKKYIVLIVIAGVISAAVVCTKKKPVADEVSSFYNEMITTTNTYADKLETVKDSAEASKIVSEYVDSQKKLIEKGRDIQKKYPELDLHSDPALQEYEKSLENATKHFTISITSAIKKYMSVKEFKEALTRLKEIEQETEK